MSDRRTFLGGNGSCPWRCRCDRHMHRFRRRARRRIEVFRTADRDTLLQIRRTTRHGTDPFHLSRGAVKTIAKQLLDMADEPRVYIRKWRFRQGVTSQLPHNGRLAQAGYDAKLLIPFERRDVRVVEGARLESVCTRNRTKGSNPFLSAISLGSIPETWVTVSAETNLDRLQPARLSGHLSNNPQLDQDALSVFGEHRPEPRGQAVGRSLVDHTSRHGHDNRGPRSWCARHGKRGADMCRAFAHAAQTEMTFLAVLSKPRLHSHTVTRHANGLEPIR